MPFLTDTVRCDVDGATARLVEPLVYDGQHQEFTVPRGFVTDFASVPQALTWLVPRMGNYTRAAILHDWLCSQLEEERQAGVRLIVAERHRAAMCRTVRTLAPASAVDTDGIFRRVMRENGVGLVRRWLMWTAVRWGALTNPARRTGWLSTAPAVLGISLLAAPVLIPATLAVVVTLLIDRAVEAIR